MNTVRRIPAVCITVLLLVNASIGVYAMDVPPQVPGELVYVPFPVPVGDNGLPEDWTSIPSYTVKSGPSISSDPGENGSFSFSLAADETNLFLRFTMVDRNIIGGKHGADFWNEDSLEFYLNDSGDLNAKSYGPGIVQVNVNATGIDTGELALSGQRLNEEALDIRGRTFRTADGWGFEAAIATEGRTKPVHGAAFGFQAQANGASTGDRDVKLIWSAFDTSDKSWKSPSLFGTAVYFQLGSEQVPPAPNRNAPPAARVVVPPSKRSKIRINQHGYPVWGRKIAVVVSNSEEGLPWTLENAAGSVKASGTTEPYGFDQMSKEYLHHVDFSDYRQRSAAMTLRVGPLASPPINIGTNPYEKLSTDAVRYFYRNRAGIDIEESFAGDQWAHEAWFKSDNRVRPFRGTDSNGVEWNGGDYELDAGGGWFDAGDYGKYVVNAGVTVWTLANLYERYPQLFPDASLPIPEKDNGVPDILDEIRWEMDFLLGMQVPEGEELEGMVHHKLHEPVWHGFPMKGLATVSDRFVYVPSTAATLDMAANAAQFARLIKPYDRTYSRRCLAAAERAWKAASLHPEMYYGDIPGNGGGNYDDNQLDDEWFFAATELYLSTGKWQYRNSARDYLESGAWKQLVSNIDGSLSWQSVGLAGAISLVSHPKRFLDRGIRDLAVEGLVELASRYLKVSQIDGYRTPLASFVWGSNSVVLNKGIVMAVAAELIDDGEPLRLAAVETLDYLLGRNAIAQSFISGYGLHSSSAPHHRFWANEPLEGYPEPPPGVLVGGPNASPADDAARGLRSEAMAKRYIDNNESFSTNEVAINWNAPLVWMASWASLQSEMSR